MEDDLVVTIGGEVYALIVDSKELHRTDGKAPSFVISAISSTARFDSPRATPIDKTWDGPVEAKAAAEEAVGEAIQWDLVNWLITGGRLAFHEASPLDVVRTIVEAVGGLVESLPDGTLRVRHHFPVAVPGWTTANVDHVFTDKSDNLSCRESHVLRNRVNKVLVRGYLPTGTGFLWVEVDSRPDGLNHGQTTFYSGDTAHLLVHAGDDVALDDPVVSAGVILPGEWDEVKLTQDVLFDGLFTAMLDKPAISIDTVTWLGNDLGRISREADNRTLTVPNAGVGIARVTYRSMVRSWSLSSPSSVSGLSEFPVQVRFTGTTEEILGSGEIFCQRGDGAFRGPDISDPLLTTDEAKRSRGRAEIDAGESLQEVSLTCLHRPGLMPGQLVEVHDALMGQSWRGKITSVSHNADQLKIITSLEVLRYIGVAQ